MEDKTSPQHLRILIIGGSIAGLTLAHSLSALDKVLAKSPTSKIRVSYTVLEKRPTLTPQEGASVGILPHGGRILDQLGLFRQIEEQIEPLHTAHLHFPGRDGFVATNESPKVLRERFGLPLAFLERRGLLRILAEGLEFEGEGGEGENRVLCGKEVERVERIRGNGGNGEIVVVRTKDGGSFEGDLVVGCDGVHSRVRREMWRISAEEVPGAGIEPREGIGLTAEYACIFGISIGVPGLRVGEHVASLNNGHSFLTFPGKDGRTFWFLMRKLDQRHVYANGNMPRFMAQDTASMAEEFGEDIIWGEVTFRDLWERRVAHNTTVLEENVFDTWHYKRILCIGDSMHKMAPNTGQGANCAIEDAAALANLLHDCLVSNPAQKPSTEQLDTMFRQYTAERKARVEKIYKAARLVVRLHARDSMFLRFFGRYVLPYSGDLPARAAAKAISGATKLSFLPLSERVSRGWKVESPGILKSVIGAVLGLGLMLGSLWLWREIENSLASYN
ncbi:FAD/NAD(P)-binding domain-containing protein [Aspergillus crustosus]